MAEKAEKKEVKKQVKSVAEANTQSTDVSNTKKVEEKKSPQTVTAAGLEKGKYKLADPKTHYAEPDFTLTGDQEKELPSDPSPELIARIRSGFIVKA